MSLEVDPAQLDASAERVSRISSDVSPKESVVRSAGGQASAAAGDPRLAHAFSELTEATTRLIHTFGTDLATFSGNLHRATATYRAADEAEALQRQLHQKMERASN